ncbi:neurotrimin-like isoform X2 [Uranotaenia lowii]|uniref:neurotrimin-like isoform X2 n=1 Tax=Uranotaenia lowii TaxID=190385 RepID=UPI00247A3DBD|nr:neurotrimin-like isoform X2 [Uranotaenia lowii]
MCQDRLIKLLIFGFVAGLLLQESSCQPANGSISKERRVGGGAGSLESQPDEEDYEYDDEDEPSRENGENEIGHPGGGGGSATQLLTKNQTIETEQGEMVTLPCQVHKPAENTIVMWWNGTQMLYTKTTNLTSNRRLTLGRDSSLTIRDVQVEDDSIYKCTVLPIQKSAFITLKVKSPPYNVRITHGNTDYTNTDLEIQQRDRKFIIHCRASGYPTPLISWSFRGKPLDDSYAKHSGITIRKEFLEIHDVRSHHSGDYECLAQNGVGEPISVQVQVQIKASPTIVKHIEYLNTAAGENAEISCLYHSNPEARKIQWFRDDELLHNSAKHNIVNDRHNHHMRTRLTVRNVEQKDMVKYQCRIENALGQGEASTVLGILPGGVHLLHANHSDGLLHTVWRVRSAQPLSDLQVLYKGENTKYTPIDATISEQNREDTSDFWTIKRSIALPVGEWFITARAKNTEGWSKTDTTPIQVQIPSEITLESNSQSGSGSDRPSMMAGSVFMLLLATLASFRRLV